MYVFDQQKSSQAKYLPNTEKTDDKGQNYADGCTCVYLR